MNTHIRSGNPNSTQTYRNALPFAALLAVAVCTELAAAWLAYHTIGAIASGLLFLAVALNAVPVALYALRKQSVAVLVVLVLFAAVVPYQAVLGQRMLALGDEAGRVVSYLYEARLRTGEYPSDLSGYVFRDAGLKPYFQSYERNADTGGFGLYWYVGTPNTSHSYSPRSGWGYYPD